MSEKSAHTARRIEDLFSALVPEEKASVISHGVALRLSDLQNRHFLAKSKIKQFEEKYHTTLEKLDAEGLPSDAGYEMHEDYIMWHHWAEVIKETNKRITALQKIAEQGLYAGDIIGASK
jgi:hypothetical protein